MRFYRLDLITRPAAIASAPAATCLTTGGTSGPIATFFMRGSLDSSYGGYLIPGSIQVLRDMTLRVCCLLYTSDAADEEDSVDLGGRRIIKKKKRDINHEMLVLTKLLSDLTINYRTIIE
eukprot:TRINITY_DN23892_c0_g1_i1.p1 TRINITY_DN23892_c0_g1~~TRINITY_DN23892_c0_g1_i1.p1  ORF type:complete len:120 (-),score=13.39 TRINITY_DN23892_c0_g1_i1:9-368(-)